MNLKECRFDCSTYYDSPVKDKCGDGESVDCEHLLKFIDYQKQQFGMNVEKILEKLIEELS